MMTPIETQPTIVHSVAASPPGMSSAADNVEARAAGPSVVAVNTEDEKARIGVPAVHPLYTIAEEHRNPQTSGQAPAEVNVQPHPQPPPSYAAALQQQQQQQPMTLASFSYPSDGQVLTLAPANAIAAATNTDSTTYVTTWMPKPLVMTQCPPGLEYLSELGQLEFIEELATDLTEEEIYSMGIAPRRYSVRNTQGQQMYVADTSKFETAWDPVLGFVDSTGQVLMTVTMRRNGCPICCTGKCAQCLLAVTVEAPPGTVVGTVEQRTSGGNVSFVIKSTEGSPVLYLEGPNPCSFCVDGSSWLPNSPYRPFAILSLDRRQKLGKIAALPTFYMSYNVRLLTNVTLVFPVDLDVKVKATLAGAATMLHRYFYGIAGGSSRSGGQASYSSNRHPTRPINSTSNRVPNNFQHHHNHFPHRAGHWSRNTGHFSNTTSRSIHHSSLSTSHRSSHSTSHRSSHSTSHHSSSRRH